MVLVISPRDSHTPAVVGDNRYVALTRDAARCADAGQISAAHPRWCAELRTKMGWLSIHHFPRRRRSGDWLAEWETDDPLFPRNRRSCVSELSPTGRHKRRGRGGGWGS